MIDIPTLFILGAGASKPYGFPTGRELRTQIIRSFPSDYKTLQSTDISLKLDSLKRQELAMVSDFVEHFSKSPVYSIDQFLAFNPAFSYQGKMAIAYYIRTKEIESKFWEEPPSEEDWYSLLFNRMIYSFA
ncbi:MAG: hypothetical protein ABSB32_13440 [Thermodesulfobacteriota bacterium]|jgi:hypothetical protein